MRLKSIKLAGFKSFVDATTVPFPSNLSAIVGPNGCGKSNIIDAVRWVMGESSARYLRGESMADVIFNGSSGRKPVGQASIELIFDNSDGTLGGEYGRYSEIGVRRQVSRDGKSDYFLNGSRCRRKDITDIFLGTGLGPRSYAIIEQGMISRLIEARPEELRVYIEEAAGVSKYKERRRETENRLSDTRENLTRVDDILRELNANLDRLEKQAEVAAKYNTMHADATLKQHQLWFLKRAEAEEQQNKVRLDGLRGDPRRHADDERVARHLAPALIEHGAHHLGLHAEHHDVGVAHARDVVVGRAHAPALGVALGLLVAEDGHHLHHQVLSDHGA